MIYKYINFLFNNNIYIYIYSLMGIGDWGLGIGDWGLGVGVLGFGPNPKSPIPNPQSPIPTQIKVM